MGLREYTTAPPEQAVSPAKATDRSKAFFKGCMSRTSYLKVFVHEPCQNVGSPLRRFDRSAVRLQGQQLVKP
jgi:hypothetical protein